MATLDDLNSALDATAKLSKLDSQVENAAKIMNLVNELIAEQKYAEVIGAIKALELITSAWRFDPTSQNHCLQGSNGDWQARTCRQGNLDKLSWQHKTLVEHGTFARTVD